MKNAAHPKAPGGSERAETPSEATLHRRLEELTVLHAVAVAGTEATSEDALLERATQLIGQSLYPDSFGILLLDPQTHTLHAHNSYHLSSGMSVVPPIPQDTGITGRVLREGRPVRVADVTQEADYLEGDARTRSELCVPLKIGGRVLGVVNAESYEYNAFTEADERLLATFAGQLATAIDRLRGLEAAQTRAQQMATLYDVGRRVSSILTLDELLAEIVRLITETLDLYNVEIALVEGERLAFQASYGGYPTDAAPARQTQALGEGIAGKVAATGQTILVPDVTASADYVACATLPEVRSELGVPLRVKDEVIGVLSVKSDRLYGLDDNDAALLEILAAQVAVAVQNARLFDALQHQTQELTGLYEIALTTSSVLDPNMLLYRLYDQIHQLLAPDLCIAALYHEDTNSLNIAMAMQDETPIPANQHGRIPLEKSGLSGWVVRHRQTLHIDDLQTDPVPVQPRYVGKTRSWLGVPLLARDRVVGALSVQAAQPRAFNANHRRFLESLASQVAVALENARLYHEALELAERLSALHWASQEIISAGMEPDRIYNAIHAATSRIMPSEAFVIALLNAAREQIDLVYLVDKSGHQPPQSLSLGTGLSGHIIEHGEPVLMEDIAQKLTIDVVHYGDPEEVRSVLAVPLQLGDQVFGMLSAQSYRPRAHNSRDIRLLEMLAAHAAVALDNARLFRAEQERSAELEAVRQASLHVTSQLELDAVLHVILEYALNLAGADNTYIFLYKNDRLSFGAARWSEEPQRRYDAPPREDGLTYAVARGGVALVVSRVQEHPLFADTDWDGAVAGFPLRVGEDIIGVMDVTFDQPHCFDANEQRALELLADQAAIAIRNAELFEATQRQVQELSVLRAVAMAGAEATDEDALIARATELIGAAFYPDNFGVLLLDNAQGVLRYHPSYQGLDPALRSRVIPLGEGIMGRVALQGEATRVDSIEPAEDAREPEAGARAELCVPLRVGEQIIGVVSAQNHAPHAFDADDERLLVTFASQLATAIEKARLFAATAEALAREQRLDEITRIITSTLDLDEILPNVVRLAAELVAADAAMLTLVSENETAEAWPYVFSMPGHIAQQTIPKGPSPTRRIIERGEALLLSDYSAHPNALPALVAAGVRGVIGVPITVGGETIGALELFGLKPETRFASHDVPLVESIGRQTGITIQNARLFAQAQQRAAALAAALARLEELDKLKSEFIQNVSHELRMPLAIIRGYAELLEAGEMGALTDTQQAPIEIITRRSKMLSKMVEDLTAILETETEKIHREPFDLVEMTQMVVTDFGASADQVEVRLRAEISPGPALIYGDMVKFRRVLDNLIGNALKFTPEGGTITARLWVAGESVILEVADTGIGIPEDKLPHIFERFYQVDGSMKRRYGGTGLGLALVNEIVRAHGGTVDVESVLGEGSTFRVTLPRHTGAPPSAKSVNG